MAGSTETLADLLKRVRELDEKATPGPWTVRDRCVTGPPGTWGNEGQCRVVAHEQSHDERWAADAALIAKARTALPALCDHAEALELQHAVVVAELRARLQAARAMLRKHEWSKPAFVLSGSGTYAEPACPECRVMRRGGVEPDGTHAPGCAWAEAMGETP